MTCGVYLLKQDHTIFREESNFTDTDVPLQILMIDVCIQGRNRKSMLPKVKVTVNGHLALCTRKESGRGGA